MIEGKVKEIIQDTDPLYPRVVDIYHNNKRIETTPNLALNTRDIERKGNVPTLSPLENNIVVIDVPLHYSLIKNKENENEVLMNRSVKGYVSKLEKYYGDLGGMQTLIYYINIVPKKDFDAVTSSILQMNKIMKFSTALLKFSDAFLEIDNIAIPPLGISSSEYVDFLKKWNNILEKIDIQLIPFFDVKQPTHINVIKRAVEELEIKAFGIKYRSPIKNYINSYLAIADFIKERDVVSIVYDVKKHDENIYPSKLHPMHYLTLYGFDLMVGQLRVHRRGDIFSNLLKKKKWYKQIDIRLFDRGMIRIDHVLEYADEKKKMLFREVDLDFEAKETDIVYKTIIKNENLIREFERIKDDYFSETNRKEAQKKIYSLLGISHVQVVKASTNEFSEQQQVIMKNEIIDYIKNKKYLHEATKNIKKLSKL